jgi:hypothetical protein
VERRSGGGDDGGDAGHPVVNRQGSWWSERNWGARGRDGGPGRCRTESPGWYVIVAQVGCLMVGGVRVYVCCMASIASLCLISLLTLRALAYLSAVPITGSRV